MIGPENNFGYIFLRFGNSKPWYSTNVMNKLHATNLLHNRKYVVSLKRDKNDPKFTVYFCQSSKNREDRNVLPK